MYQYQYNSTVGCLILAMPELRRVHVYRSRKDSSDIWDSRFRYYRYWLFWEQVHQVNLALESIILLNYRYRYRYLLCC